MVNRLRGVLLGMRSRCTFQIPDSQKGRLRRVEGLQGRRELRTTISSEGTREIAGEDGLRGTAAQAN